MSWPSNRLRASRAEQSAPTYRAAPHNIEAEQALLGAILVNNEALYRVSDFLEPQHFFEPIHQQIYEISRSLIRTGKLASPVTLKTFLPADIDIAGLTLAQYLARLAAEATTIINAGGLRPHHLRPRDPARADRHRRGHGQRRLRRAGRFRAAATRSRTPSAGSTSSPRPGATAAASRTSRPR